MKKHFLITVLCLAVTVVVTVPHAKAYESTATLYEPLTSNQDLCRTLRLTCVRQQALNATANRALRRHQKYSSVATPDVCLLWKQECTDKQSQYGNQSSCMGYCPDGTTYNSCSSIVGRDPCHVMQGIESDICETGTVPKRVCTIGEPSRCYTTCTQPPSECRGVCSNGRTYNICTMGPTYECLGR